MPGSIVRKTIPVHGSSSRSTRATSSPLMPGMELSRTITSGRRARAAAIVDGPSAASPTTTEESFGLVRSDRSDKPAMAAFKAAAALGPSFAG